jgi:hypothetical protein
VRRSRGCVFVAALAATLVACTAAPHLSETRAAPADAAFERDRRAILAMTGEFEVRFAFRETVPLAAGYEPRPAYRSAGWERVEVALDEGRRIVLRHVLVTRDGRVTKHWTQDWRYEDPLVYEYRGDRTFAPRRLTDEERRGAWTQAVYQVDEGPRYESAGRWTHFANTSAWNGGEAWRPLPRREHTKRSDYDVLVGTNRHEIVPSGWEHAQDNLKLALRGAEPLALVREIGRNRYVRTSAVDFEPARAYASETAAAWELVRDAFAAHLDGEQTIHIADALDGRDRIEHFFHLVEEARGKPADPALKSRIDHLVTRLVAGTPWRSPQ